MNERKVSEEYEQSRNALGCGFKPDGNFLKGRNILVPEGCSEKG